MKEVESGVKYMLDFKSPIQGVLGIDAATARDPHQLGQPVMRFEIALHELAYPIRPGAALAVARSGVDRQNHRAQQAPLASAGRSVGAVRWQRPLKHLQTSARLY